MESARRDESKAVFPPSAFEEPAFATKKERYTTPPLSRGFLLVSTLFFYFFFLPLFFNSSSSSSSSLSQKRMGLGSIPFTFSHF